MSTEPKDQPETDEVLTPDVEATEAAEPALEPAPDVDVVSADDEQDPLTELQQALERVEAEAEDFKDKLLRSQAEMENVRRRSQQDVEKARKFGVDKMARELLGIRDSMEMGLDAAKGENASMESIQEGTELTLKMMVSLFEKFDLEAIEPVGQPFDPAKHEAMSMVPSPDAEPNTVIQVIQKGYALNGRVLRPALVMVASA